MGGLAVLLAVGGAVLVGLGVRAQEPAPSAPSAGGLSQAAASSDPSGPSRPDPHRETQRDAKADAASEELTYSRPVRVKIPRIKVDSRLVELGLDSSGVMETPEPVEVAGWFKPSPPPGIPGATVLAGHVTWDQAPTVFFRLGELRPGDRIEVDRADGAMTVFQVTRIGTFPKDGFPTQAVYNQPERSELRLITCGGRYDEATHRYLSNIIVWARIVDIVHS